MPRDRPLILVVDDDAQIRSVMRSALIAVGYDVEVAEDGVTALESVERLHPDLVILDMVMPNLNGWGVLRRLTGNDAPPVIAVSGEYQPASALASAVSCVRGYVIKPIQIRVLTEMCARVLGIRQDAPAPHNSERRKETRCALDAPATLLGADRSALAVGRTRNISRAGVCIHLGIDLIREQSVRLHVELPGTQKPLFVHGLARWSRDGNVGLKLADLDPTAQARLDAFLHGNLTSSAPSPAAAGAAAAAPERTGRDRSQ